MTKNNPENKILNSLQVKLCGFKRQEDIEFAAKFPIDFMGFIFYEKSPRNVDLNNIAAITKNIPQNIKKVAVIVDASNDEIAKIIKELKPNFLQLHGSESLKRTIEIKTLFQISIIKAFRISDENDLNKTKEFEDISDYFLFDAKVGDLKGGTGKSFDWNILKNFKTSKKWFLSGGINADNLLPAIKTSNAKMVDLSSAIEKEKGIKSKELIEEFMAKIAEIEF